METKDSVNNRSIKILVAEDNPTNLFLIKTVLKMLGHKAHIVENGLEVIEVLKKEDFDLILMDIQMPKKCGIETCIELIEDGCKIPIIAVTAHVGEADRIACFEAGMVDFILKPYVKNDIDTVIKKHFPI